MSIIIPVFNAEKTISKCLNSILKQVYKNWECIIINDGSTDNSLAICKEYQNKDKRFKIFTTENKGVSAARNKGIKESTGEYICFVDADDTLNQNKLDICYKLSYLNDADIVYHSINVFVNNNFKTIWDNTYEGIIDIDNIVNIQYYFSNVLTKLYKASLIKDNNI
ncbi:glycosyltransferase family 2 protein [bacterium]|nr:glycosyltransferase family 2 protein [bacterium]